MKKFASLLAFKKKCPHCSQRGLLVSDLLDSNTLHPVVCSHCAYSYCIPLYVRTLWGFVEEVLVYGVLVILLLVGGVAVDKGWGFTLGTMVFVIATIAYVFLIYGLGMLLSAFAGLKKL